MTWPGSGPDPVSNKMSANSAQAYPHPAWLTIVLSIAPAIGLGICRFGCAFVLPDRRAGRRCHRLHDVCGVARQARGSGRRRAAAIHPGAREYPMTSEDTAIVAPRGAAGSTRSPAWPRWLRSITRNLRRALRHRGRLRIPSNVSPQHSHEPTWSCRKAQANVDVQSGILR
jgi:hypothetical protein